MPDLTSLRLMLPSIRAAREAGVDPGHIVGEACRRAREVEGIFTALVPTAEAMERAEALARRAKAGEDLPLLGVPFAVKDNIHVAGMATTSNCPALSIMPAETAQAVQRLERAGAVLIGKNTMDQFATGLNGTRSPEPLCRNAVDPTYIPGGSSSGSAVAVARDVVAFSLGSDTGGSGRVPAACNGIVGLKPSLGLVSMRGVLYNSRLFDCIPVFARDCADAYAILELIKGYDPDDPYSREDADTVSLAPSAGQAILAVPRADQLTFHDDASARAAHAANLETLQRAGYILREIDFAVFGEAGRCVFQSAMVAERLHDYGDLFANQTNAIHPAVRAAIEPGLGYSALDAFKALYELKALERRSRILLGDAAALVVPTVPTIFTIEAMLADPMTLNAVMGTYTYFVNPLDLCAVSVPGHPRSDGLPSALCFIGRAGRDGVVRGLATAFEDRLREHTVLQVTAP